MISKIKREGLKISVLSAYLFAKKAHKGQKDKAGKDYILHPKFVASKLKDENLKIVALLHDTVEDTNVILKDIETKFGKTIADAIDAMTKRDGGEYMTYLARVKANPLLDKSNWLIYIII